MADVDVTLNGEQYTVPEQDLQQALNSGARVTTDEDRAQAEAQTYKGKALAFATGADEATFGLGTELGLGVIEATSGKADADQTATDIRRDREANQGYVAAGGLLGSVVTGPAGLEIGAESALGRVGVTALEGALQGAAAGAGHAMTEKTLGNPEANAESYFADQMAEGFLFGGATGGVLGGLGEAASKGLRGLGVRKNSRALGELGAEVVGGTKAEGRALVEGFRGSEGAVDEIMGLGKYTLAEAQKVVGDIERVAKQSVADGAITGVFDGYAAKIAKDDPKLAAILKTQFESGAHIASKTASELDDMSRDLARRGDKVLGLEETLYEQSITNKGRKMAELVDPTKSIEATDTAVGMIRNARAFAEDAEGLMGGKGLARSLREEADRFEQAVQGRARQASAAEEKAAAKLAEAEESLAIAGQAKVKPHEVQALQKARDEARAAVEKASKSSVSEAAATAVSAADIFMAADNFKRNVGKLKTYANGNMVEGRIKNGFEPFYNSALMAPLENAAVWGDAAASAQREVNAAWQQRLTTRNDLGAAFLSDFGKDMGGSLERADAGKFRRYLEGISGPENDLKREALGRWLDGLDHAMNQTEKHYGSVPTYGESRKAITEMRETLGKAADKAKTIEALNAQKLSEGEGLGGMLGLASDVFTRPLKTAERLAAVKQSVDRVGKATERIVGELFGSAKDRAASFAEGARASMATERKSLKEASEAARQAARAPEGFMASIQKRLEGLSGAAPEHARAISSLASRAVAHLAQHAPAGRQSTSPLRTDGELRYTDSELDSFARRLRVVEDPLSVVKDAANGKLTIEQMNTLREVYPSIYNGIRERAWDQILAMKKTGQIDQMPYSKRLSIGILLDIPSDATMEPQFIAMIQASKTAPPKPGAPAGPAGPAGPQKAPQSQGVPRRVEIDRSALTTESARIEQGTP